MTARSVLLLVVSIVAIVCGLARVANAFGVLDLRSPVTAEEAGRIRDVELEVEVLEGFPLEVARPVGWESDPLPPERVVALYKTHGGLVNVNYLAMDVGEELSTGEFVDGNAEEIEASFTLDGGPVEVRRNDVVVDGRQGVVLRYTADFDGAPRPLGFSQLYVTDGALAVVVTFTSMSDVQEDLTPLADRIFGALRFLD